MLEWLWAVKPQLQYGYAALLFLVALCRGAAPERLLATVLVAMLVVDQIYHLAVGGSIQWRQANLGHLAIDLAVLAAIFAVALHANRIYPLWIGASQIIAVLAHLYRLSLTEINRFAYDMMSVMPSYIQLTALTLGLSFHMSRRRRLGSYRSWRGSWSPTPAPPPPKPSRGG